MSVLQTLKEDLAKVGENVYSESKQTPGRDQYNNQLLGDIGSEGISDPTYKANSVRIIKKGRRRRPQGYWQSRMTTSGLDYSQEVQAEATLNVANPNADVAAMVLDDEADESDLFKTKIEDRMQERLDAMQGSMTATSGNDIFQVEKKMGRIKDRLKTEMP